MSFWLASPSSFFWIKLSHWSWTFLLCPELSGQKATGLFLSLFPELALQLHTETGSFLVSVQELDSGLHVCKAKYLHYPLSHVPWPWTLSKDVKQGVVRGVAGESPQGKKKTALLGTLSVGTCSVSQVLPTQAWGPEFWYPVPTYVSGSNKTCLYSWYWGTETRGCWELTGQPV